MITSESEYLSSLYGKETYKNEKGEREEYNKSLAKRFPWLIPPEYKKNGYYGWTWLDAMETGWRLAFGIQMCEEIQKELERINYVDEYVVLDVKEKWAELRWTSGGVPIESKILDIIDKYEKMSKTTCVDCGKQATYESTGYILPFCESCVERLIKEDDYLTKDSFVRIHPVMFNEGEE